MVNYFGSVSSIKIVLKVFRVTQMCGFQITPFGSFENGELLALMPRLSC